MLRARLFGGLAVEVDDRPVPDVPGMRPRALLAYLLMRPGAHPRSRLAGLFWPDVLETSARASLRSALWTVRGALEAAGGGGYLHAERSSAGIAAGLPREVDLERFDALLATGGRTQLEEAVRLAREPLLPELPDEWAMEARDAARERAVEAHERLAAMCEQAGDLPAAVEWTRAALRLDRLREAGHRALMMRLAAAGERAQAIAAYRRCRDVLGAELGIPPSAETRAILARLREGAPPEGARPAAPHAPAAAPPRAAPPATRPALRGREAELAGLLERMEAAGTGRGGVVLLAGEAGIGKSRLAEELLERAAAAGAPAARGAALDLEGGPPFGPWAEALRDVVRAVPAPPAAASWPAELARLCPAVEAAWGRTPAEAGRDPEVDRLRLFEAVAEALAWGAREGLLAVLLEDMHRADPASLALLGHAGRRLEGVPCLLLVTARPGAEGLERALDAVRRREHGLMEVGLEPLGHEVVSRVVADAAPGIAAAESARVVAAAGGNPLLARAGARALAAGQPPEEGLRGIAGAALRELSGGARELLELAAAAGRPLGPGEAAELVGGEDAAAAQAAVAGSGLLAASYDGRVAFGHDLLRRACYAEVPPAARRRAHARLAEVLARRGGTPAEVARHLRLAGESERARAFLAAAAADARRLGALDEAARFLREGAELGGAPAGEAEMWLAVADVEAWRGARAAMDGAFARARALLERHGDPAALAQALVARGRWLRTTVCYPLESLAAYREALELLERTPAAAPELEVLALAGAAWAEAIVGDPARAEELIAAVEGRPETARDRALTAELALDRTMALIRAGRTEEADALGRRAAALAEEARRPDLAWVAWGNLAAAAALRRDFGRCLELLQEVPPAEVVGPGLAADALAARTHALSRLGRYREALEAAREGAALGERYGIPDLEATATYDLGCALLAAGETGAAADALGAALAAPRGRFSRPLARLLRAEALLGAGEVDGAGEELERFPFEPVAGGDLPGALVGRLSRVQGLLAAARGRPDAALRRLGEAEATWRRLMGAGSSGDAFAAALADLGRPPVAGLVEPDVQLGATLADRAAVLGALDRREEAEAAAREAREIAERTGYEGYRARLGTPAAAPPLATPARGG